MMVGYNIWLFSLGAMAVSLLYLYKYISKISADPQRIDSTSVSLLFFAGTVLSIVFSSSVAAFFASILALIWSGSQLAETSVFHRQFDTFIVNGACNGVDILPVYWPQRDRIDMAILVLNVIFISALGALGAKLVSVYRKQMTKVTGEEKGVIRSLYKVRFCIGTPVSSTNHCNVSSGC
jgi:hypothetical protein